MARVDNSRASRTTAPNSAVNPDGLPDWPGFHRFAARAGGNGFFGAAVGDPTLVFNPWLDPVLGSQRRRHFLHAALLGVGPTSQRRGIFSQRGCRRGGGEGGRPTRPAAGEPPYASVSRRCQTCHQVHPLIVIDDPDRYRRLQADLFHRSGEGGDLLWISGAPDRHPPRCRLGRDGEGPRQILILRQRAASSGRPIVRGIGNRAPDAAAL